MRITKALRAKALLPRVRLGECHGCPETIPKTLILLCDIAEADGEPIGFCRFCLLGAAGMLTDTFAVWERISGADH